LDWLGGRTRRNGRTCLLLLLLLNANGTRITPIRGGSLRRTLSHNGLQRDNVGILGESLLRDDVKAGKEEELKCECEKIHWICL
jgi:hypothetical protein